MRDLFFRKAFKQFNDNQLLEISISNLLISLEILYPEHKQYLPAFKKKLISEQYKFEVNDNILYAYDKDGRKNTVKDLLEVVKYVQQTGRDPYA